MANNDYITTDCKLTISKDTAKLDEELFLYKNDKNIKLLIQIEDKKYRYKADTPANLLTKYKASYAQVKWYNNYSFLESDFDFSYNYNSSADLFILDNKIYNFVGGNDENTTYGYIHEWTIDYENKTGTVTKTLRHNIGHVNSVSYCEATNTLICGNGSSNYVLPNKIYIINNFSDYISNGNNVEYSDAIIIDVSSENWGSKINVVWGEYNNENYNIIYVITNNNKNVRKVMLNKTDGNFNGNYVVLQEWVNEDVLDVNQGTCFYKGKLYFNIGHGGINVIEYTLLDNGSILMKKFVDKFYDEIGNEDTSIYGQGIDIKNGHLVIGTTKGNRIYNI